mgnify:CR=1 FL=1|tara:strand:- start:1217 stop:3589 length:2373 start_codon:yes stop_codon:yes gene_type:complete
MSNCISKTLIPNVNNSIAAFNAITDSSNAFFSNAFSPISNYKYDAGTLAPANVGFCTTVGGNLLQYFDGLNITSSTGGTLAGMPQIFYPSTYFWYDSNGGGILNDLINAGYATVGQTANQVFSSAAFVGAGGQFSVQLGACQGCSSCTLNDVKEVLAASGLASVYYNGPSPNSINTFQQNTWNNYLQWGCNFFYNRILLFQSQLPNITSPYQIALKTAKIDYFQQMYILCGCGLPPAFAPTTSQLVKAKQEITFLEEMENDDPTNISAGFNVKKVIQNFDIDLGVLQSGGGVRAFQIQGTKGFSFKLEIKNEDDNYYNFKTQSFSSSYYCLEKTVDTNVYNGEITFPVITDDDHYDIYLYATKDTKHASYVEARFADGSLDLNNSIGSDSNVLQKIIYQYTGFDLTISTYSSSGNIEVGSQSNETISVLRDSSAQTINFSIACSVTTNTKSYRILRQPRQDDFLAFITRTVGAAPVQLRGEDIYPAVTGTDTVNGAVTSGTSVTMDSAVASKMKVGDRITGNAALNATTVTVVSLDSTNVFTMSQAVAIADGITLSFSNQMNYQWPLNSIHGLGDGMIVVPDTNVLSGTKTAAYEKTLTILENTEEEKVLTLEQAGFADTLNKKPTIVNGEITDQDGNIVFNKQQALALAEDSIKIGGYGTKEINRVYGYDVEFKNLKITLSNVTTTTTSGVSNSTSVPVASRNGIVNGDTVTGIGINASVASPTVSSGGSAAGAGTLTLSAAQTLENGVTLNFAGSGQTITITGEIKINRTGNAAQTIRLDVDRIVSIH